MTRGLRWIRFSLSCLFLGMMFAPVCADPRPSSVSTKPDDRIQPPPPGRAQVVFFRPSAFDGIIYNFAIRDGDQVVAQITNGTYAVVFVDPGVHTFSSRSEVKDTLTLDIDPDETYYVEQTIGVGLFMGRPHLAPSGQSEFDNHKSLTLTHMRPNER